MAKFYNSQVLHVARRYAPGLLFALAVTSVGFAIHQRFSNVSPLVASLVIGVIFGNLGAIPKACAPGQKFALLGTQLAVSQVIDLGGKEILVVVGVVAITFLGTTWLGPKIGVSPSLSLLIGTGFSICGASAVAAMDGVVEADEEEVTYAIALVTLCGSLAIVLLPLLRNFVGLQDASQFGAWVGASVHDVAQVVATSSTAGKDAVASATVVKLSRVVLLAPLVAIMGIWVKRSASRFTAKATTSKVSAVPMFVVGFLAMIALRTSGVIPEGWLSPLKTIEQWCLAVALVGLGSEVKISKLFKVGGRPLLLALISWASIATVSLLGITYIS
jgi:uncharacterized integral membrane protein (TIGR00698 family)